MAANKNFTRIMFYHTEQIKINLPSRKAAKERHSLGLNVLQVSENITRQREQ
jgi:hypothetical protein